MHQPSSKQMILITVAAIAIISLLGYFVFTAEKPQMKIGTSDFFMQKGDPAIEGETAPEEAQAYTTIMVTPKGFEPSSLSIKIGETVSFQNKTDDIIQLHTKSERIEIKREVQQPNASRKISFNKSGTAQIINVFNRKHKFTLTVRRN